MIQTNSVQFRAIKKFWKMSTKEIKVALNNSLIVVSSFKKFAPSESTSSRQQVPLKHWCLPGSTASHPRRPKFC
jgi:hypothetical protein